jgi:hypothetical protein
MPCRSTLLFLLLAAALVAEEARSEGSTSVPSPAAAAAEKPAPAAEGSGPLLPDATVMAPVLAEEPPVYDTTGWPASPSAVAGERVWPPPIFTHWPGVIYRDERRHAAVAFPLRIPGFVSLGWQGQEAVPVEVPLRLLGKLHSGLVWLPDGAGEHLVQVTLPGAETVVLPLRIIEVAERHWPHDHLREGMPVDAQGRPLVLRMTRWEPEHERRWAVFAQGTPRPDGAPVLLGDPLAALGEDCWPELPAEQRLEAVDARFPQHAALVALARIREPWPATLIWSPGNGGLAERTWNGEDERLLGLIRARAISFGVLPRLVLLLPPLPVDADLREEATRRRELLRRTALFLSWEVLDSATPCGAPEAANRLGAGIYADYPVGPARERLRALLADTLAAR